MRKPNHRQSGKTVPLTIEADARRHAKEESWACELDLCGPLEKLAASVPGVICSFRLRPDGTTAMPYASPAIFDLYGFRPEEVASDAGLIYSRIHPDDAKRLKTSVSDSALAMTQWHEEWRFDHPLKGERWIEGRSMPVRESDGSVLWHGYLQDVTERKEGERRIAELNAYLRLLTDAVPALISYVDTNLRYRMVNRSYERWFGHPAKEIEGRTIRDLLGEAAWKIVSPNLRRALAGERLEFETELPSKDGESRWVQVSYFPDIDAKNSVRGIVIMVVDLTEHRRIEDELRRSRKQFADLMARQDGIRDSERRHVAREVHDELGQLLTGMRMALSAFRMRGNEPQQTDVMHTAQQLDRMLDQTTDVVRRISVSLRSTVTEHGLLPALEGLATDFRNMTKITCRLTVSGEIRPIGDPWATTVFRIVQESLTNIARHAQAKSVSIHLSCDAARLRIAVQDDGRGFDPEAAQQTGSGLGLFGMRERAAIAGGKLRLISSPGKGTRLELDLPFEAEVSE
ncbi:MAG: PAS domain-containing protein [Sulfuricellaceae bacterium]|nr:PAS domain-containing protein [Sulfuricellaceae bacterium]